MAAPDPTLRLAIVFESADPVALGIVKAALEEAEIEFTVSEDARMGYAFSPILNPVCRIQVARPRRAEALELIEELLGDVDPEPAE
jgi:hypothetical protein